MTSSDCDPNQYLIKAIETLKRQIIVISDDYKILASRFRPDSPPVSEETNLQGRFCHQAIFNQDSPCLNCPAIEVIRTNRPVLNHIPMSEDSDKRTCLFAYPLDDPGNRRAIVVLDFHLPSLDAFDEKRFLSNAFLKNLIHSAVDGVIAADMKGKILIFNQAASDISGYTREEAMDELIVQAEPAPDADKTLVPGLKAELESRLREKGLRTTVQMLEPGSLERTEFKAKRVIDKRSLYEEIAE